MPLDYTTLDAEGAGKLLKDAVGLSDEAGADRAAAYERGDHWQGGAEWRGPKPAIGTENYAGVWQEIRDGFVSKNVVKEVTGRHKGGVIGREPDWSLAVRREVPEGEELTADEQTLIDEAEAALIEWWDSQEVLLALQTAVGQLLTTGRGPLRLFVPPSELQARGERLIVPPGDLAESIQRIALSTPDYDTAAVHKDPVTRKRIGVYQYKDDDGNTLTEVSFTDGDETVIRTLSDTSEAGLVERLKAFLGLTAASVETRIRLGGRLIIYEMRRDPLITEQVMQSQGLLNMALTMLPRNVVLAGFMERIFFNTQRPKVRDSQGNETQEDADLPVGAGATTFATGVTYTDENGNTRVANPSVVFRDPVPIKTFEDTARVAYENILDEVHQRHIKRSGGDDTSGESKKQDRADYAKSLLVTKAQLDAAGRWLLETVLKMAATFAGTPDRYDGLRASFDSRLDAGPMSAEDINTGLSLIEKKVWSRSRLQSMTGVEDPDAETQRIAEEEDTLNPAQVITRERQQIGLQADREAAEGTVAIARRLAEGSAAQEAVN